MMVAAACAVPWPVRIGHLAVVVHAGGVIAGGKRIDLVEMIALDPVLEFAGLVAGVLADFEHGDDDDLDRDGARLGGCDGCEGEEPQQAGETSSAEDH